jgi:hypothetical protein
MRILVLLLEEPSAQAMLEGVLSRILPEDVVPRYIVFEGKQDLEKQLEKRLRGWKVPGSCFLIMRDQDSGDCLHIKEEIKLKCQNAGKPQALVRIACRELESYYLGDLAAVEEGLGINGLASQQDKARYRVPDGIMHPAEELRRLTHNNYQKLSGSRSIGPRLSLDDTNRSHSFNILVSGIKKLFSCNTLAE